MTRTARENDLLTAALRYAELGYPVFPCAPGKKIPATPKGFHNATCDPDTIRAWWAERPTANIGLPTAGLIVIDLDGAANNWPNDPEKGYDLGKAGAVGLTANGGKHYVFREPAGKAYRNTAAKLADHVDTRADGGYIVAPPSVLQGGKHYRWAESLDLSSPRDELPEPPAWLVDALDALAKPPAAPASAAEPGNGQGIPSGKRNATLTSLAGKLRRAGLGPEEILPSLLALNARRCNPTLPRPEVERIATSVGRYQPGEPPPPAEAAPIDYEAVTFAELAGRQFNTPYLVEWLLADQQPCILAGPKKSLKTSFALDLALALSQGGFFLGRFRVPRAVRTAFMSGESGLPVLQETGLRIASAAGYHPPALTNLLVTDRLPRVGDLDHLGALRDFALENELEALLIDPAYLALPAENTGDLHAVGQRLRHLNELTDELGLTIVLVHHTRKHTGRDPFDPPELEDIAWSGYQEWARQWLLLGRRDLYEPGSGEHRLWLTAGGSMGHSGRWAVDLSEGVRTGDQGRFWAVEVTDPDEARHAARERHEAHKEADKAARLEADKEKLCRAMARHPQGETATVLRDHAGLKSAAFKVALADLLNSGDAVPCELFKPNRKTPYEGYKLMEQTP